MENVINLSDSFKIVLVLFAAMSSFFSSVAAFVFGIFVYLGKSMLKRPDEMMSLNHMTMAALIPTLYMVFGVMIHSIFSMIFSVAYDVDLGALMGQFLAFDSNSIEVPTTIVKIKDKLFYLIASIIPILKAFALNSAAIIYLFIPIFFLFQSLRILEVPKLLSSTADNTSIFAVIFYAGLSGVIGLILNQFYASIINQLFFSTAPQIDNLGQISSIGDYTTAKLKEWIGIGLSGELTATPPADSLF